MPPPGTAPTLVVPTREIVAVEHPMVIKNIDNGLKTFGTGMPLKQVLLSEGYEGSVPLYLRPVDPTSRPLLSNNTASSNVVIKLTVPKRTGRKRKRGTDEPYTSGPSVFNQNEGEGGSEGEPTAGLRSHSRLDDPKHLLQTLKDNVGKYKIETVGSINQTHRYRGVVDFHYSTFHGKFMTNVRETMLTHQVENLRKFKFDPSVGVHKDQEIIPPPTFTDKIIPVNWGYHQNSSVRLTTDRITGESILVNQSRGPKLYTFYVAHDTPQIPLGPPSLPPPDPVLESLLVELRKALDERPIWTRRAILNHVRRDTPGLYLIKPAIQYVGYQFRGGPWRDAIVRYGIDPRTDPQYRIYQTLFFKIVEEDPSAAPTANTSLTTNGTPTAPRQRWHDRRSEYTRRQNQGVLDDASHVFDGTSISLDGKIWQVCDITDPLLARLLSTLTLRPKCDIHSDGWYLNGLFAKVRAIMRTKINAIRIGLELTEADFEQTLSLPDHVPEKTKVTAYMPQLPAKAGLATGKGDDMEGEEAEKALAQGSAWRRRRLKKMAARKRRIERQFQNQMRAEKATEGPVAEEEPIRQPGVGARLDAMRRKGISAVEALDEDVADEDLPTTTDEEEEDLELDDDGDEDEDEDNNDDEEEAIPLSEDSDEEDEVMGVRQYMAVDADGADQDPIVNEDEEEDEE